MATAALPSTQFDSPVDTGDAFASLVSKYTAGLVAGLLGGVAMNMFVRAVSAATGGREADDAAPGHDREGRGMQPPQSKGHAEDDAATQVGSAAYEMLTGRRPSRRQRLRLGTAAHYTFAGAMGAGYSLVADRLPLPPGVAGALYGAIVWAVADEAAIPALGLSRRPEHRTAGMHAFSLAGHCIYGATVECVRDFALTLGSPATDPRAGAPRPGTTASTSPTPADLP